MDKELRAGLELGHPLTEGQPYWCTLCNKVHHRKQGSEEYVTRTCWVFITPDGKIDTSGEAVFKVNIGFCNGAHGPVASPPRYAPAGVTPVVHILPRYGNHEGEGVPAEA